MVGANYMGGRRNAARARLKDANGKAQKGHFMKQRHQLLTRALHDRGPVGNDNKNQQAQKREEISFAHAQRDLGASNRSREEYQSYVPVGHDLGVSHSSSRREDDKLMVRSKLLEKLDIEDPSGLRRTMDRILSTPDLAGLSGLPYRYSSIKKYEERAYESENRPTKRQRTESISSDKSLGHPFQPVSSPKRPLILSRRHSPYRSNNSISSGSGKSYVDSGIFSSPYASAYDTHTAEQNISSEQFSMTQECGTPNDSGFSELTFSDALDSLTMNSTSPAKITSDHSSRGPDIPRSFLSSSPTRRIRFKFVPQNSNPPSIGASRTFLTSAAVPRRPTLTTKPNLARPALPTYSGSSPINHVPLHQPATAIGPPDYATEDHRKSERYVSLLEVEDPWRFLDDVLGLEPSQPGHDFNMSPENLISNDRTGVGYKTSKQITAHEISQHNDSLLMQTPERTMKVQTKMAYGPGTSARLEPIRNESCGVAMPPSSDKDYGILLNSLSPLSSASKVSAREIVPMKRHILSTASQIRRSQEPSFTMGTVTSIFALTPPRKMSPTKSSQSMFSSSSARKNLKLCASCVPSIDSPHENEEHLDLFDEAELSVSATVRQILSSSEPTPSQLDIPSLGVHSSPATRPSATHNHPCSRAQDISNNLRDIILKGPDLFSGIDEDDE